MARPKKQFKTKAEREKHEAGLARRRAKHKDAITLREAEKASSGQSDFQALVEAEKDRIAERTQLEKIQSKGGSTSPKTVTQARDNLSTAFDLMGGVAGLVVWGRENPTEFYRIWARLIPKEVYEPTSTLPLETLLSKLADRESMTVAEAAIEIGHETMEKARDEVWAEDGPPPGASVN